MKRLPLILALWTALLLAGCYYGYPPGPVPGPTSYDRSFYAAADAMRDQGVAVQTQEPTTGNITGYYGSTPVAAMIRQQADGSVRVEFQAADSRDPGLVNRITQSYQRRMGR
ncbi:hypothetical protein [Cupriavidus sp. D384]|uniref:hypothetical protein n=1 Tax=Cupriavidus sp. D384 TaxID=1538095 RepID=UPI000832C6FE|nr:hypothetical protein [Cupriavidus sp. D384]